MITHPKLTANGSEPHFKWENAQLFSVAVFCIYVYIFFFLCSPKTYIFVDLYECVWAFRTAKQAGIITHGRHFPWIFFTALWAAFTRLCRHIWVGGCANIRTRRVSAVQMTVTHLLCCDSHTLNTIWVTLMHPWTQTEHAQSLLCQSKLAFLTWYAHTKPSLQHLALHRPL